MNKVLIFMAAILMTQLTVVAGANLGATKSFNQATGPGSSGGYSENQDSVMRITRGAGDPAGYAPEAGGDGSGSGTNPHLDGSYSSMKIVEGGVAAGGYADKADSTITLAGGGRGWTIG